MSKWEKASDRKQDKKIQMLLEQNFLQQQEVLDAIAGIGDRLDQTNRLLEGLNPSIIQSAADLKETIMDGFEENREDFQAVLSLLKAVLVNEILDDMEKLVTAKKIR